MTRLFLFVGILSMISAGSLKAQSPATAPLRTIGKIEVFDSKLEALVDPSTPIEILAEGFTWTEGPCWIGGATDGHLLFSDIPRNSIFRWKEGEGISLFMNPSGYTGVTYYGLEPGSNGLLLDSKGQLVLCEHGDRRVSTLTPGGGKVTLADSYQGKRLNSPNDGALHSSGDIYFTDPPYGLPMREKDPRRELEHFGVYRINHKTHEVTLLTTELERPNGIAFSPDCKTLYVAQSDPKRAIWMAFNVNEKGLLENGRVIHDVTDTVGKLPGLPDGMTVDSLGNLWASGPGGIYVMTSDGKPLGRLTTGEKTSNCTFGADGKTLFMTVDHYLCRVKLKVSGT